MYSINTVAQDWRDSLKLEVKLAWSVRRLRLKCDGTRAETKFRLSAKRTSPFKSAGASVQSATGSRGVRISGSNAGYTMFRGTVKSTGYPLHSPVSPSLPLPCVTVCHHISTVCLQRVTTINSFFSTAIQFSTPSTQTPIASARQHSLQYVPR
jgi:hypothetical protein